MFEKVKPYPRFPGYDERPSNRCGHTSPTRAEDVRCLPLSQIRYCPKWLSVWLPCCLMTNHWRRFCCRVSLSPGGYSHHDSFTSTSMLMAFAHGTFAAHPKWRSAPRLVGTRQLQGWLTFRLYAFSPQHLEGLNKHTYTCNDSQYRHDHSR
jgi:hypothetical protein